VHPPICVADVVEHIPAVHWKISTPLQLVPHPGSGPLVPVTVVEPADAPPVMFGPSGVGVGVGVGVSVGVGVAVGVGVSVGVGVMVGVGVLVRVGVLVAVAVLVGV